MHLRKIIGREWEVDGTGSGSCPLAGFGVNGVENFN
jgi:hypothetical protein